MTRLLVLLFALAGGATGTNAVAAPAPDPVTSPAYVYSFAGVTNDLFANVFPSEGEDFATAGTTSASAGFPLAGPPFFATGQATAAYGALGAAAQAFGQAPASTIPGVPGGYAGIAGAIFTDGYTITGGSGTASTSTTLSGSIGAAADALMAFVLLKSAAPFYGLEALEIAAGDILLTGMLPPGYEVVYAAFGSPTLPFSPLLTGSYGYTSGVPVYLAAMLLTYAEQSGAADFLATAGFGISAPPGGALSTVSGFAYAQAVPEPGTWAMLGAGLALLGLLARRRVRA